MFEILDYMEAYIFIDTTYTVPCLEAYITIKSLMLGGNGLGSSDVDCTVSVFSGDGSKVNNGLCDCGHK